MSEFQIRAAVEAVAVLLAHGAMGRAMHERLLPGRLGVVGHEVSAKRSSLTRITMKAAARDEFCLNIQVALVFFAAIVGCLYMPMFLLAPFVGVWLIVTAIRLWS
jgi:hypothetical protein